MRGLLKNIVTGIRKNKKDIPPTPTPLERGIRAKKIALRIRIMVITFFKERILSPSIPQKGEEKTPTPELSAVTTPTCWGLNPMDSRNTVTYPPSEIVI
jgi:hypothetical protein